MHRVGRSSPSSHDPKRWEGVERPIEAGPAGVHLEDQLASEKKCGHMGGKVLLPTSWAIRNLVAARLAADVSGVPTVIIARTDADAADMVTSDADERDHAFITGERTGEGFFRTDAGIEQAIARGIAYAPYADLVWCETAEPDMEQAERFARELHEDDGYTAAKHRHEVGASSFEAVAVAITGDESETTSVRGSTEEAQFSAS